MTEADVRHASVALCQWMINQQIPVVDGAVVLAYTVARMIGHNLIVAQENDNLTTEQWVSLRRALYAEYVALLAEYTFSDMVEDTRQ